MNHPSRRSDRSPHIAVRALHAVLALALAGGLGGCSTVKGWFGDDKASPVEPSALAEFAPSLSVTPLWSAKVGNGDAGVGIGQAPVVEGGHVYTATVSGDVRALDLQTGRVAWAYEAGTRLGGGPGVGDGLLVVGGLEGDVIALDAATGTEKWRAKVGNEVIAAPAVGQGRVFVRSNDGRVTAFDAATGERRWFRNHDMPSLTVRGNDAPALGPGVVFVGNDDGSVAMLAIDDGRPLWAVPVAQPEGRTEFDRMADVDGTPVLDGSAVFATSYKRRTVAIDGPNGRPVWVAEHGGAGRPAVASDRIVVAEPDGGVFGLDKQSGAALWRQPGLARRGVTGAAIVGEHAVLADFEGYVHWLRLDNGDFAARSRAGRDAVRAAPVVADGVVVVQNVDGGVAAFRVGQ
ncbi:outer membrane protein assembly factor BamB [Lysobacter sp. N42]|uniref:outer membrane protein assembly factor BamB n=1 Tax=Lysobacter sp. N42 TaxID=2545719 RepID=UPI0010463493|nr:outer membrane protein assembly factor BamB [Lysobacter sp. N42]TCZ87100.1 outer membrane protein assembly factor BamB [Lysobacter sp. N42]